MSADISIDTGSLPPEPVWIGDALVARCAKCAKKPGARYADGSGICHGCNGAGFHVLARRATPTPAVER